LKTPWLTFDPPPALFSSLLLYYSSSLTRISNSALNVSIVFYVSFMSYSLFSIWVFNNFLSFLLSSSSYLHLRAFFSIFSLLWPKFWKFAFCYYNGYKLLSADPISLSIKFLKFLISATYCKSASLFFWRICSYFSLTDRMSSMLFKLKSVKFVLIIKNLLELLSLTAISGLLYLLILSIRI
jgi:hypothetical protein